MKNELLTKGIILPSGEIGKDIPIRTVEPQQRHADQGGEPRFSAAKAAFPRIGQRDLQNSQKNHAGDPAKLRHIKDPRRGVEQQQVQCPVKRPQGKAAVEAEQQKIRLSAAFLPCNTRKQRAEEGGQ